MGRPATTRKQQIADLVREGLSNREIAGRLSIEETTVKQHLSAIYRQHGLYGAGARVRLVLELLTART